ncbi:TetR/AcrR family transcriptional regulator [Rubrobacter tropicus]|uniref:TetR/AcrR family transcriptional regulator n=1 Tax=Rubrobacter tropicus TaxID=2653851 RepID=UPI00140905B3|nr:TetR/AcrR family transcriptional regulator [Rubrobacter tropicus]
MSEAERGTDVPGVTRPLTSRQRQAAARREEILKTALGLFAAQGFDATSTKQIAREVGIAEGLVFHYFPTKAGLLAAVLEARLEGGRAFRSVLRPLLEEASDRPAAEVLGAVASGWLATLRRDEEIVVVLFTTAQTNPEVWEAWQGLIREGTELLTGYLAARVEAGELREDLPLETAATMFVSSLMVFFLTRRHLPEPQWREQGEAHARELVSVWLDGARA